MSIAEEAERPGIARGVGWMLLGMGLAAATNAIAKWLAAGGYPLEQILWGRYVFAALLVIAVYRARIPALMRTPQPALQIGRGVLALVSTAVFYLSVGLLPLAEVAAMWALAPVIITALSVPVLREAVGWRRWIGVACGFAGALLVIRPGTGMFQPAILVPLAAAFLSSTFQLTTRIAARRDSVATSILYDPLAGLVVSLALAPFVWVAPDGTGWLLIAGIGVVGGLTHFTIIRAYAAAPAAVVAPFIYTNLVWSAVLGLALFGDWPDLFTVGGATLIVVSGLYILHRERVRQLRRST